jgi:hypothetical protein
MTWLDEIAHSGPHDIYEKLALVLDQDALAEFLVRECQSKDRYIKLLTRLLEQELGKDWWQMYADHITTQHSVIAGNYLDVGGQDQAPLQAADIPL